jgi:broad specificity phosphatase PhoE
MLVAALVPACPAGAGRPSDTLLTRPRQILLIRHAEKPDNDQDIHLSPKGKARAEALPWLFRKTADRPDPLPRPDFLFATKESKHSNRPVETVTPLARELNLFLSADFEDNDFGQLAAELLTNPKYGDKTVLVCWHHGRLPDLARALKAMDVPDEFKDHFDRVWVVAYDAQGNGKPLVKRHQELLPGDSKD